MASDRLGSVQFLLPYGTVSHRVVSHTTVEAALSKTRCYDIYM